MAAEPNACDVSRTAIIRQIDQALREARSAEAFEEALQVLADQARRLLGAHQAAVSYIPQGDFTAAVHAVSLSEKYAPYRTYDVMPTGAGIWSLVVDEKVSFCLTHEELLAHPRWRGFSGLRDARGLEHPPMRGWLAVPVLGRSGHFTGLLQFSDKSAGEFTAEDLNTLTHLATLVAPTFELQYLHEEVERTVAELRRAKAALERSNQDLQQFASVASHDLQEPLRAVAGYCGFLQERLAGQLDEEVLEFLQGAIDGAKRMQTLISDLLDYSRVESRGGALQFVDANLVVQEALRNLHVAIDQSQAQITCGRLPTVVADTMQLVRLFQNLIGNAVKFRRDDAPRIHVEAREEDSRWLFCVRDNGIGIDEQYAKRIFVIFQRLHAHSKYPGTGLGLAICKRIVERHGGSIWVQSQKGTGSTFFFTLPKPPP